ncbi:hypothetical protein [Amycolatopsis taiwanensis]|uniref:Uncharacterized protein n=1 Tax=Amycolatopsis taiwanensis TaxID=342230 RepID=A0A9W6R0T3_9PSEU|nr:hypothetical protein [Amycolatopsis taiwanensis]GLY67496.1 hypothetical protein Atai01_41150 [Amycolatopsis taiwanensis]
MTRVNVATRRGTASAGRWLTRALLVAGGALAGTAIAWAIGNASASADPITDTTEITGQLTQGLPQLAGAVKGLGVHSEPAGDGAHQRITGDVRDVVHTVARDAALHPAQGLLGSVQRITGQPRDIPQLIGSALAPPNLLGIVAGSAGQLVEVPSLPATKPAEARESVPSPELRLPTAHAGGGSDTSTVTVPSDSGAHETVHTRARGGLLPHPAPSSPLRELSVPAELPFLPNGSASGCHADGPVFGLPASTLTIAPANLSRAVARGSCHLPAPPGAQPGVTPD